MKSYVYCVRLTGLGGAYIPSASYVIQLEQTPSLS